MRKIRVAICILFIASCVIYVMNEMRIRATEDTIPPQILCEQDTITVSVEATDAELMKGLTASDNKDGDLTAEIRISETSNFISKGERTITYVVFDRSNLAATCERTLIYEDYVTPKIYLTEPLRYNTAEMASVNLLDSITAVDCLDGDISKQVTVAQKSYDFFDYQPGVYEATIQVNNSAGDVCAVPVEILISDTSDREENLKYYPMLNQYIAYTQVGEKINPSDYVTGVIHGGAKYSFTTDGHMLGIYKSDVEIDSHVDVSTPGVYTVDYTYTSEDGVTAVTKLYVVVEE